MKLSELYQKLEKIAPQSLSDEYCQKYDGYDNSGVLIDCGNEVKKVVFTLDFSPASVAYAVANGANVIVTHHPAIYNKLSNIVCDDPQGGALQTAIQKGISVISMHLNFDCAKEGIDYHLMRGVGGKKGEILEPLSQSGTGYGRAYDITPTTVGGLCERLKAEFSTTRAWAYNVDKNVERVASFCGAGGSENGVLQAVQAGADCIVSADLKHHVVTMALGYGLGVIELTHYASEDYGFYKIYQSLKEKLGVESLYFTQEELR